MNNEKNKRIRIGETKVAEVKVEEQDINVENLKKDEDSGPEGAEFYNEAGEFDWDSFEAT